MELITSNTTGIVKQMLKDYVLAGVDKTSNYMKITKFGAIIAIDATNVVGDVVIRPVLSAFSSENDADFNEILIDDTGAVSEFTVVGGTKKTIAYNGAYNIFFAAKIAAGSATGTINIFITV